MWLEVRERSADRGPASRLDEVGDPVRIFGEEWSVVGGVVPGGAVGIHVRSGDGEWRPAALGDGVWLAVLMERPRARLAADSLH
jgi:hypothetical protein